MGNLKEAYPQSQQLRSSSLELKEERRRIATRLVAAQSRGNIYLGRGQFITAEELEARKRKVFGEGDSLEELFGD